MTASFDPSQLSCLLVDLAGTGMAAQWAEKVGPDEFALHVKTASSVEEAQVLLEGGQVLTQVIFATTYSAEVQSLLKTFQANVGCIAEFQAIVCDEPEPPFMAGVYEFGIEQFFPTDTWVADVVVMTRDAVRLAGDDKTAEAKTVHLTRTIRSADQAAIQAAEKNLGDLADHDYRVAYAKGKAAEATGQYEAAVTAYASARGMNKMFRPTAASLGETLLVTGRVDEALKVLNGLERTNPFDVERKANLAAAYVEKGDFEMAEKYVSAAEKLAPMNSRVLEARAQVLLCTGKIGEAFKLMDDMSEVGPFFAAKLNELGIRLSQSGKGKSALALYQKAHRIVRPELKYKITMNAALACRRLGAWDMALKYLQRCEQEYGGAFPKLVKIREAVVAAKAQAARKAKPVEGTPPKGDLEEAG